MRHSFLRSRNVTSRNSESSHSGESLGGIFNFGRNKNVPQLYKDMDIQIFRLIFTCKHVKNMEEEDRKNEKKRDKNHTGETYSHRSDASHQGSRRCTII